MDFKEELRLYIEDGINAIPSVEILLTKNRYKILELIDAVDNILDEDYLNTYPDLKRARQKLGGDE
jgi:predicted KAP-like P-loop ATPase